MTQEKLITCLKDILHTTNMENSVSLSENANELANLMIYQAPGEDLYLGMDGTPLFPISVIRNILYEYGDDKFYTYTTTEFKLVFELKGNFDYIVEFGMGYDAFVSYPGHFESDCKKVKVLLEQYNQRMRRRESMDRLVWTVAELSETHNIDSNEISEVKETAIRYMNETPDDKDFSLLYAYLALVMFWNDEGDNFDVKSALQRITALNLEDDFIAYIEDYCYYPNNTRGDNSYYMGLTTTALRIMQEVKKAKNK